MTAPLFIAAAWAIEILVGWPDGLFRRVRHPVVWIGALIGWLDRRLNHAALPHAVRYIGGAITTVTTLVCVTAMAVLISRALPNTLWGYLIEAVIASSLIASRSLYAHVAAVFTPLAATDLDAARGAVARIVGRDLSTIDDAGLSRASLESLAENTSDGVIAPVVWGALFGLPGIACYKAVNTLDSMIGHRNARYRAFGGFAARLDDMLNLVPARLTGVLIAAASARPQAWAIMFRDAGKHRSMNAGWPEAAMAGALDVRLSGPRVYGAETHVEPWLNSGGSDAGPDDLARGLRLYLRALAIAGLLLVAIAGGFTFAT